ncbi:MAG: hypothetical protein COU81_00770 [Candidatus Portnoybacteria bacterium CG10_big_fil_rev_8_21_14_0_10_36_7]|uniref:Uncharacterized protein n=1 Tax=Candidatus Portnoybacteria bacterium CG10_big_fil_rev_8_21_14_0_10_36_7 TaxID=1974812 RepID=A0A2M8KET7_9BACT|nr:MAG: hypothetical protein COU81_00770 [Candidatus Portnoybacteria bacterium CG10_big_fil_rev_8_21_14_0_10_36_7]
MYKGARPYEFATAFKLAKEKFGKVRITIKEGTLQFVCPTHGQDLVLNLDYQEPDYGVYHLACPERKCLKSFSFTILAQDIIH